MKVSVLIPTHQRADLLGRALEYLVRQVVPADLQWEIVVANNNSTDDTEGVVKRYAERASLPVRHVFEARPGANYARNAALTAAQGEIFAFIDDDIRTAETWLSTALAVLERERADLVGGRILPEWEAPPPPWLLGNEELYDYLGLMVTNERRRLALPITSRPKIWGGSMILRRSVIEGVGAFNVARGRTATRLFSGDETDLIRRVLESGRVVVYDPEIVVHHWVPRERMRQRYFCRWVFGYAEGKAFNGPPRPPGVSVFGSPRWMYPRLVRHGLRLAAAPRSLRRQIDFFWEVGLFVGWYKRSRAERSGTR